VAADLKGYYEPDQKFTLEILKENRSTMPANPSKIPLQRLKAFPDAPENQSGTQSPAPRVELSNYRMYVHHDDTGISTELLRYKIHEPISTKIFSSLLECNDVVFDLGANIGYYALLCAKKCKKVIAVEPVHENFQLLKTNIELNHMRNFVCVETAISTFNGHQRIYLYTTSNHHSMLPTYSHNSIIVPVKTIATVLKENKIDKISCLRMDIEGYEVELLDSLLGVLKTKPRLFVELHIDVVGLPKARDYLLKLKDIGYRLEYVVDRDKDFPQYEYKDAVNQGLTIADLIERLATYRVCCLFLGG
jgi:FkbM family methyltransferase